MFRKIFALSKKGSEDLTKSILACTVSNLSLMAPFALLMFLADELMKPLNSNETETPALWLYIFLATGLVCIIFLFYRIRYRVTYVATYKESSKRRIRLAEKLRRMPLSFFGEKNLSEIANTMMNDCTMLELAFSDTIPQLFGSTVSVAVAGVILFFIDWRMALSLFSTLFFAVLLVIGNKRQQNRFAGNNMDAESSASDGVQEYLEGIKVIKASNMAQACCNDLDVKLDGVVKASTRMAFEAGKFVFSAESILRFGLAFTLITGAYLLAKGQIDRLTYFLFLMAAPVLYDPVSSILKQITMLFEAGLKIERMRELEHQPVQEGETKCILSHYNIEFKNVSFSYNSKEILHNISFTAQQGQVTALVGPSGSGKSTLAKLAARFWDVRDGCITVGGKDVKSIEPETLLAYFSIVFQDVVLFNDTLYNNIKIGKSNAVREDILAAARAAQCDEFIRRFPLGYDTIIGENGYTLSGGERQRISIARALLKNAPIILLDEATASLDTENESHVQRALSHLVMDKTVIVIAHRIRTVMEADKIVVLQDGRVLEEGTHKTLMEQDGLYEKLVTLQQRSANWTIGRN